MPAQSSRLRHRQILHDLFSLPTAPFAEHYVIDHVERFCAKRGNVTVAHDAVGNMLARVRKAQRRVKRPVCITAHLDHPGFVAERMISRRRVLANWRGGVPPEYFVATKVRFHVDGAWVRGRVGTIKTVSRLGRKRVETAVIEVPGDVPPGSIGMWDLPKATVRGRRIHAGD